MVRSLYRRSKTPGQSPRNLYRLTNHSQFRKTFITFCLALVTESIALQILTTSSRDNTASARNVVAKNFVTAGDSSTRAAAVTTPTPQPTSIFPHYTSGQVLAATQAVSPRPAPAQVTFHWPLSNYFISQYYSAFHPALDLAATAGTPVLATTEGVVSGTGYLLTGGGLMVKIDHPNGYSSYYAHLSLILAHNGQQVDQGLQIGRVGSTGWSTGPHLHFMIQLHGTSINPLTLLP